jgi:ABC-2 type transport system ATP-binding protein
VTSSSPLPVAAPTAPGTPAAAPVVPAAAPTPVVAAAVSLSAVHKRFGHHDALRGLTFDVPAGRITALLGPNGAGKTTAIRLVTGAMNPDAGQVRTLGLDPDRDGVAVRRRCGVVAAKPALYDRLSGLDNLRYSAELYGLGRRVDDRLRGAAARFGIADALDQQVGGYSTGMKTRLALARAVVHEPDLLLLDEPTSGLDPESSQQVLAMIRGMATEGTTIVLCTHLLLEAEGLADQVVMLDHGTALVSGSPDALARRYWPAALVRIDATDRGGLDVLLDEPGVTFYDRDDDGARVQLDDLSRVPDLVAGLVARGARITRVEPRRPTLEDLYFAVRRSATSPASTPEPNAATSETETTR